MNKIFNKLKTADKVDRESNFELLRILAMFLIVLHHCNVHGVFSYLQKNPSVTYINNELVSFFLSSGGKIGVSLFVLLTGYFCCTKSFNPKKWLNVYLQTLFFSVLILVSWFFISPELASKAIQISVMPFVNNSYWFITSWLLLYLFSPALNIISQKSSSATIRNYLFLGIALWVVLPALEINAPGLSYLTYFMYLYLLGAAIKLNHISFSKKKLLWLTLAIFCFVFIMVTKEIFFSNTAVNLWKTTSSYTSLCSPYTLIISLYIFYVFKDLKIKISFVNWIATSMFGVYLLHDNVLVRPWLWHKMLGMDTYMNSPVFIIISILISVCVFVVCTIIDKILYVFYKPFINSTEKFLSRFYKKSIPDKQVSTN